MIGEAYICIDCGDRDFGGWNCGRCGGHNIYRDERADRMKTIESRIINLGWEHNPLYGWSHWDVRDNDGERIMFDSAEDVAKHIDLDNYEPKETGDAWTGGFAENH